jgi:uroporphyrinogen decarboxylase
MQVSPAEFKAEIFKLVEILGRDGGFVLAPSHHIQPNVPFENLKAMFEAFAEIHGGS